MADNLLLNEGSGGSTLTTAEVTFSSDTTDCQIIGAGLISGTAESYAVNLASAGAGAVGVGVQRVTLASDDPAVALLATIDADTSTLAGSIDGSGHQQVDVVASLSVVDANNSTSSTLLSGAAFTGTATDMLDYSHVVVSIFADQASATDGLSIQWSTDSTNWDNTDVFTIPASTAKVFTFGPVSRYMRVVYTNGGTGQGAFRMQTILHPGQQSSSSHRIADSISGQDDAELMKTVITGLAPDTNFKNVLVTNNGELKTSLEAINGVTVPISADSVVDDGNSTTTPLGIGATFTGTGVSMLPYSGATIVLFADEDGAADGMRFEFSSDNSNWDQSHQHDYVASTGRQFQFAGQAEYFRVVFVNGGTEQSEVRIQTILHKLDGIGTTIHRLDDDLAVDRSATVVKASLTAQKAGAGDFTPINATAGGNLKVAIEEFDASLPAGDNNIGNVDIVSGTVTTVSTVTNLSQLGGIAIAMGAGVLTAGTQRVTLATDDAAVTSLALIDDTVAVLGTATYTETTTKGNVIGAVRNDDLATLADTDNELAPFQVDSNGALYVNSAAAEPKQASGVAAGGAPGTDDMIAAVAGKKLLITGLALIATSTTTNNVFVDNVDNDLLGNVGNPIALSIDAAGDTIPGMVLQYNPAGHFKTDAVNEAVTLNTSAAQDIIWSITWIETD